jgi:hypothetical protein
VTADVNELLAVALIAASWVVIALVLRKVSRPIDIAVPTIIDDNRPCFTMPSSSGPVNGRPAHRHSIPLDQL